MSCTERSTFSIFRFRPNVFTKPCINIRVIYSVNKQFFKTATILNLHSTYFRFSNFQDENRLTFFQYLNQNLSTKLIYPTHSGKTIFLSKWSPQNPRPSENFHLHISHHHRSQRQRRSSFQRQRIVIARKTHLRRPRKTWWRQMTPHERFSFYLSICLLPYRALNVMTYCAGDSRSGISWKNKGCFQR